jgi:hypothetical protein
MGQKQTRQADAQIEITQDMINAGAEKLMLIADVSQGWPWAKEWSEKVIFAAIRHAPWRGDGESAQ